MQPSVNAAGRGRRKLSPWWLLLIPCVFLLCCGVGTALVVADGKDSGRSPLVRLSTPPGSAADASARGGSQLNTPVRDGKFEFTVSGVECGVASVGTGLLERTPQGSYCLVTTTVQNIGPKAQTFVTSAQLAMAGKREFTADSLATDAASGGQTLWLTPINPGNKVTGRLAFDVPAGTVLTALRLHDSLLSRGVSVTL